MRSGFVATFSWCLLVASAPVFTQTSDSKRVDSASRSTPPEGAVLLLQEKRLEGWVRSDGKTPATWPLEEAVLSVAKGQGSIMTARKFGNAQLHVEFNVPFMPEAKGQDRGNSGVYLAGAYEIQILDSYGLKPQNNDCGAIYKQAAPLVNACKPPLQWQTYDVTFRKAEVASGKVIKKAEVTVFQNGIKIIDRAAIAPTPGGISTPEGEEGPLILQDHGNDIQFRNIWVKPL